MSVADFAWTLSKFCTHNPQDEQVGLLLGVVGAGDGFGVYQRIEDALLTASKDVVVRELARALRSPHGSVRQWAAFFAGAFPSEGFVPALTDVLGEDDVDSREFAAMSLGAIRTDGALNALRDRLRIEEDEHVVTVLRESLEA